MAHLGQRGAASVRGLRGEGFTLRLVAEAEQAGHVHIDVLAGVVTLQPSAGAPVHGFPTIEESS